MTGLPLMSSRLKPGLLGARAMAERAQVVLAEPAVAAQVRRERVACGSCGRRRGGRGRPGRAARSGSRRAARRTAESGPVGAMPASSVPWCSTRAGPHSSRRSSNGMNWLRIASACVQSLRAARREERAAQRRGDAAGSGREAGQAEVAHVHDRRTLADAADHARAIDAPQQAVEIRVVLRLVADDRVLDGDRDAVAHQPADRIEPGVLVRAEAVFGLQIEDQRHARRRRQSRECPPRGPPDRAGRRRAASSPSGTRAAAPAAPGPWRGRTTARGSGSPSATTGTRRASRAALRTRRA